MGWNYESGKHPLISETEILALNKRGAEWIMVYTQMDGGNCWPIVGEVSAKNLGGGLGKRSRAFDYRDN